MNELLEHLGARAKDVTSLITAVSAAAYAFGYLVLRARAVALGIEPVHDLVSGAYVFAGFRFLFMTGFFLLLVIPVLPAFQWAANCVAGIDGLPWLGWAGVLTLSLGVLAQFIFLTTLQGSLLDTTRIWPSSSRRFVISLLSTALLGAALAWLATSAEGLLAGKTLPLALALIAAMELIALSMLHGALFADRIARQLARMPDGIEGFAGPVWLVDRGKDRASVFGRDAAGSPRVLMFAATKLDGIAVVKLEKSFERWRAPLNVSRAMVLLITATFSIGGSALAKAPTPQTAASFLSAAWSALKAVPDMIGSLGESGVQKGLVWEYNLADGTRRPLGGVNDLAYPIASPDGVIAIQGRRLVRLSETGETRPIPGPEAEWVKLIADTPGGLLAIVGHNAPHPAVLTQDGTLQELAPPRMEQKEERREFAALQMESRRYATGYLKIGRAARDGNQSDVYFDRDGQRINISDAGSAGAGQPFLTPDGYRILYVRQR